MASKSNIQWTDATWSPVVGCTKISPGCLNCYAERMANRVRGIMYAQASDKSMETWEKYDNVLTMDGKWNGHVSCDESALEIPLHWRQPRRIFVCSMSDLFHKSVPFEFIHKVVDVARKCSQHTFQFLTKRADIMLTYSECSDIWPSNIIGMVTVENQEQADRRIPLLLQCGFKTTGVSIEPMLGAIDIRPYVNIRQQCAGPKGCGYTGPSYEFDSKKKAGAFACPKCRKSHTYLITDWLDQVILGGESGPGARPMHPDWPRRVRDDCVAAGVPFFFKQWGEWVAPGLSGPLMGGIPSPSCKLKVHTFPGDGNFCKRVYRVGKKKAGRLLDGKEWAEYPK